MKIFLGLVTIITTLVIAGRQPSNNIKRVLCVLLCGFMVLSSIAKLPDSNDYKTNYSSYTNSYNNYSQSSTSSKAVLTKEEADRLRGTGYHNTRPDSLAEDIELKAAQVKCKECGLHSDNGSNSLCDYCQHSNSLNCYNYFISILHTTFFDFSQ